MGYKWHRLKILVNQEEQLATIWLESCQTSNVGLKNNEKFYGESRDTYSAVLKISEKTIHCLKRLTPALLCKCPPTQWGFSKEPPGRRRQHQTKLNTVIDGKAIFENVPLRPEFTVTPAISFAAGPGAEGIEIDDLKISMMNPEKDTSLTMLFKEDFERFEDGKLPEHCGWKTTKFNTPDKEESGQTKPVSIHDTKHLIIKSIQGKEVIAVKHFNLSGNFPLDVSDRTFEIRYNSDMDIDMGSMEPIEADAGHGPYGEAAFNNTSVAASSSSSFSRTQSGNLVDTYYIYSHDGKLMAEYDHSGNCVRDYIYSGNLLIAEYRPQTNSYYYYMSDQVNTTRIITDGSGNVVYSAIHSPYGDVQKVWTDNYDAKLKFSGKEREGYSELDYFGARYYDHNTYRFNSVDPIINKEEALENPQLWNLYAYCSNNPVTFLDPDGRSHISCAGDTYLMLHNQVSPEFARNFAAEQAKGYTETFITGLVSAGVFAVASKGLRLLSKAKWVQRVAATITRNRRTAERIYKSLESQLKRDGAKSIFKALKGHQKALAKHLNKLRSGLEHDSQVKATISRVKIAIKTTKKFIKDKGLK